jgi:hypothetical protein
MALVLCLWALSFSVHAQGTTGNPVVVENRRPGTEAWRLSNPATDREIEGYGDATSVDRGGEIRLYVNTRSRTYTLEVFRMGWYQGLGGRRVFGPLSLPGTRQTTPDPDSHTGLVDANWIEPFVLTTADPADQTDWTSGVYLAKLTDSAQGKQSYIIFVVRDDDRVSDLRFQLPVSTYQSYNYWGGRSLYDWNSGDGLPWATTEGTAAVKVSFNRPYVASPNPKAAYGVGAGEFLTNLQPAPTRTPISSAGWDYNMVRWLEREGYDVSYITNLDTHVSAERLRSAKAFLSVGHDEYWSWQMRDNVEAARDAGVNLGFFSANTAYWQVRFEDSPATGAPNRVMVSYKNREADPYDSDDDPSNDRRLTILWRDPPVSRPEERLMGVGYGLDPVDGDIVVSNASHWVFENTGLRNGSRLARLLGYEVDGVQGDGPANLEILATSRAVNRRNTEDSFTSNMTIYSAAGGAMVFATGTIQWSWGLDDFNVPSLRTSRLNPAAEQITHNVLARFGARLPNAAPRTADDSYFAKAGQALAIPAPGVLGNDRDREPLTARLATTAAHGSLGLQADGSFRYLPDPGFTGVDGFSYRADDGLGPARVASVAINVGSEPLRTARCVRLVARSEVKGRPVTSAAEIILVNAQGRPIDPSGFAVRFADSEELVAEDGAAANALDGDASTNWHTRWKGGAPAHPHEIEIDLGQPQVLSGFRYLPRQGTTRLNGAIKAYEFHVSADCLSWDLAAQGEWATNDDLKEVRFKH